MKRILLTLLAIFIVLGLFALTGYRVGYAQGVQVAANREDPLVRPFERFNPHGMDNFGPGRDFNRGFGPTVFLVSGFRFLSPLLFLGLIAALGLMVWFIYWLFTRNGWQFARTTQTMEPPPTPAETEKQE